MVTDPLMIVLWVGMCNCPGSDVEGKLLCWSWQVSRTSKVVNAGNSMASSKRPLTVQIGLKYPNTKYPNKTTVQDRSLKVSRYSVSWYILK